MNMNNKPKVFVIVGPTASGKTGLSIELAKRVGGEVISADSRQVYRALNIGTEKVTREEMQGVPHHCIDIASPRRAFSTAQWKKYAEKALRGIVHRHHTPIVTGGTGMYVDALLYNLQFPEVPPNPQLRRKLQRKDVQVLLAILAALDPRRAKHIETQNPRRLIRAIEIATALGSVPPLERGEPCYHATWIGLFPGMEVLEERIVNRLEKSLTGGLIEETRYLIEDLRLSRCRIDELGLEYRLVAAHLRGDLSREELRTKLLTELRRYAKRQMTWFRRNKEVRWYKDAACALEAVES